MHVYTLLLTSSLKASHRSLKLKCRYWMQAYLQGKVGDKSTETHALIKRDQQCVRELHTDARDASAQSQRACFAWGGALKLLSLEQEGESKRRCGAGRHTVKGWEKCHCICLLFPSPPVTAIIKCRLSHYIE